MGTVWRAEDRTLCIEVALKLIDPALVESPVAMARFQQEAHAAARLRSTHIVHINDYGVDVTSGQPFIAMDLLDGESLRERLDRQGTLPFFDLQHILSQVARGLELAHSRGIAHRDLTPANIYLAREGGVESVKVLDFGIAKRLDDLQTSEGLKTGEGQMLGTPYYMSPEQVQGMGNVDHRTDIWAMGVIAFECLTGRHPFESDNLATLVLEICSGKIRDPAQFAAVPIGFSRWFARALSRDVHARYPTIHAAANELAALVDAPLEKKSFPDSSVTTMASASVVAASLLATKDALQVTSAQLERPERRATVWALGLVAVLGAVGSLWWVVKPAESPSRVAAISEAAAPRSAESSETSVVSQRAAETTTSPSVPVAAPTPAALPKTSPSGSTRRAVAPSSHPQVKSKTHENHFTTSSHKARPLDPGI